MDYLTSGGHYQVSSVVESTAIIGIDLNSEGPNKKVVALPEATQGPDTIWSVEPVSTDPGQKFILKCGGLSVYGEGGKIWAGERQEPFLWDIKHFERGGGKDYVLTGEEGIEGWYAEGDVGAQISYRPLIVAPSYPPFYPPTEVFKFTSLRD
ncbi:hypothetical protein TWF730_004518 [Orbilia blumenaviensis]|uniref:Carbohydrate-binding module family 13 protein n=1 Tax=Orbilia blumenaviensis TaxID=1796055 RepID=A0AAV9U1Y0_9PEZI